MGSPPALMHKELLLGIPCKKCANVYFNVATQEVKSWKALFVLWFAACDMKNNTAITVERDVPSAGI